MMKMIKRISKKNTEKGQSIVLIALVFVGLLAFIGLTVDMGVLFIGYGNLRRAVDNAALAAATQMRETYTMDDLRLSAAQFLRLNDIQVGAGEVNVETCENSPSDIALCPTDRRKLVRVTASIPVEFAFLPVIGFYGTTITAEATAEAASMDVVLVIDISESMASDSDTSVNPNMIDPIVCNSDDPTGAVDGIPGSCSPFQEVKQAAADVFAATILNKDPDQEEDRIAIVVFSNGWQDHNYYYDLSSPYIASDGSSIPRTGTGFVCPYDWEVDAFGKWYCVSPWISDRDDAQELIRNLQVYQNVDTSTQKCSDFATMQTEDNPVPCSLYDGDYTTPGDDTTPWVMGTNYQYSYQRYLDPLNTYMLADSITRPEGDASAQYTTNIGGGLKLAAAMFSYEMRKDALWLTIMLTDGGANATEINKATDYEYVVTGNTTANLIHDLPLGYCPKISGTNRNLTNCKDNSASSRHVSTAADYDADDYARDMADLVSCDSKTKASGCNSTGQGAIMFSIGLGKYVAGYTDGGGTLRGTDASGVAFGDSLLRYIAAVGDDGDPATDACSTVTPLSTDYSCGNYYFSSSGAGLENVFKQIVSRVFTRITK